MTLSLRLRIVLTLLPLLVLLAVVGATAVVLLYGLGDRIDAILRDNYDSVIYMERLKEALERIDSSFTFALAGREDNARQQYQQQWEPFLYNLGKEQGNITVPGEDGLVERLTALSERYRRLGDDFYRRPAGSRQRQQDYFGTGGLLDSFKELKDTADTILRLNQDHMEQANRQAKQTARDSLVGFGLILAMAAAVAGWLAWRTVRAILRPIQAVTQSALAIGAGDLDQIVPVMSRDELGRLAQAFNTMARQLRHYRQTDYSRLLRAQRTSQATIDSFPHPVLVVDPEGEVEMANPAAQRILGVSSNAATQPGLRFWRPPAALQEPLREALAKQTPYLPDGFDRAVIFRVDGKEHFFLPRILPIQDPYKNSLGAAVLLEDVTRFQLLDQVKSDLVATVSHELKTPLTSIRLDHHLLLEEAPGPLTPKQTELLLDARDNAERLLGMVNQLLDLARLEQGRQYLDLRPEQPAELLRAAADAIAPRAEDENITVVVDAPAELPPVCADAQRLGHALNNLLDNAVTYSERGGRIHLSATSAGATVTLTIADSGRGIPAEYVPQLFDKFFRIPGQRKDQGTGLGLAIVREIVTAHGGTIACDSQPGSGTVFRIKLPVWKDPP